MHLIVLVMRRAQGKLPLFNDGGSADAGPGIMLNLGNGQQQEVIGRSSSP